MAAESAEINFAKKLANNEKKIRDKAVRKLRAWLSSRPQHGPGFKEVDLLKIWKGLFYCMWMSDKPLVQEELAENISQLIHSLKNLDSALLFIKTFFKTMNREWHGIDRLRMDKFYLLIRKFINNSFQLARNKAWDDSAVKMLMDVYGNGPLSPGSQTVSDGMRLHLCTVYLPELESVAGGTELPPEVVLKFLDPLFILAAQTKSKVVSRAVKENVVDYLIKQRETQLSAENDVEEEEEEEVNDDGDEVYQSLQIDYSKMVERLLVLASDRDILGRNRNQLYQYAKRFKSLLGGTTLVENGDKPTESVAVSVIADEDEDADNGVQDHEGSKKKKKRKKRKIDNSDELLSKRHKCQPEGENAESFKTQELQQKPQAVDDKSGKLGKKKKKKENMTPCSETLKTSECTSKENTATSVQQDTNSEALSTQDEHSDIGLLVKVSTDVDATAKQNETRQTLITSENTLNGHSSQILGKKENTTASKKIKHTNTSCKRSSDTFTDSSFNNTSTEIHSSNASLNGFEQTNNDLVEDDTKAEDPRKGKKARTKHVAAGDKPFAVFQKVKATPPAFLKKAVSKITPKTGPRKHKVSAADEASPKSDPAGLAKKRVRIALSRNTAHTTHDYRKSLTESPVVPFDALRTPTHGLLKSGLSTTPREASSAVPSSQNKKRSVRKRPAALDFF